MESDRVPSALTALTDLLGLTPVGSGTDHASGPTLGLLGPAERPLFLLPLDHRAAVRAACTAYTRLRPVRTRVNRRAIALAMSAGLGHRLIGSRYRADVGPGSLLAHLAEILDTSDLEVAVGIGNHDEVWKPTLQCFTPAGVPVAYVKVGLGPVGAHLVANEQRALTAWSESEDPRIVVPTLLARTSWQGAPILCSEPMPADVRRLPPGPVSPWAVRLLDPPVADCALAESPWWTSRTTRHAGDPAIADLLDAIERFHGDEPRAWARWHGDWVPWNLARSSRGLVAWDWEYSEPGAPVGLDEVHSAYQQHRNLSGRSVEDSLRAAHRTTDDPWIADAHLAMLVTRHATLRDLATTEVGDHHDLFAAARTRSEALRSSSQRP